jgi:hypothetical protein
MTFAKDDILLGLGIALTIGAVIVLFLRLALIGAF